MKEKYNFKIDFLNKNIIVDVVKFIFPVEVILQAAYHFIEDNKIIIEGDTEIIKITFIPNESVSELEMEELAYEFNIQLISSFVEDDKGRRYSGIRETIVKTALQSSFPFPKS